MSEAEHVVEVFLGPIACACSGLVNLKEEEKYTQAEMIIKALREHPDEVELLVYRAGNEETYGDFLSRLATHLRSAGEDDFADRVAFSIRYVTPAVAVDGALKYFGQVPSVNEFLVELGIKGS